MVDFCLLNKINKYGSSVQVRNIFWLMHKTCYFVRICSAPNPIEQDQEFLPKDVKCLNRGQILNKASVLLKASPSFGT